MTSTLGHPCGVAIIGHAGANPCATIMRCTSASCRWCTRPSTPPHAQRSASRCVSGALADLHCTEWACEQVYDTPLTQGDCLPPRSTDDAHKTVK
eukprot:822964-Pelagomonas_calceolata.AAC.10